jgi:hypothetical protein
VEKGKKFRLNLPWMKKLSSIEVIAKLPILVIPATILSGNLVLTA